MKKVYSRLADIPRGAASDGIVEGCLVLEGGAFRGLYTQGFLDAMMVNGINMGCVIGVSAGALGGHELRLRPDRALRKDQSRLQA